MTVQFHIAGVDVTLDGRLRQRCSWCGFTMIDQDLNLVAVMIPPECARCGVVKQDHTTDVNLGPGVRGIGHLWQQQDPPSYPRWEIGALIGIDGGASWVEASKGDLVRIADYGDRCCMMLDPEVTA